MKRLLSLFLLFSMIFSLVGCAGTVNTESTGATESTQTTEPGEVIILDAGTPIPTQTNARVYYHIFVGSINGGEGNSAISTSWPNINT